MATEQEIAQATSELQDWAAKQPGKQAARTASTQSSTQSRTVKVGPYAPEQLMQDADVQISASDRFLRELQNAMVGIDKSTEVTTGLMMKAGAAQAKATQIAGENSAATALSRNAALNVMHAATGDPGGDVVRFAAQRHDAFGALEKIQSEIDVAANVSLLDDPLTYMVNLVRTPQLKRAYNSVAMKVNTATANITSLQQEAHWR